LFIEEKILTVWKK